MKKLYQFFSSHSISFPKVVQCTYYFFPTFAYQLFKTVFHGVRKKPLKFLLLGLSGHVFDFFSLEVSAAFASVASCCLIDSALYGWRPTVVPWNFFRQNVLKDVASFYGTHTWHW